MTDRVPRKESDELVAMRPVPPPFHLIVEARRTASTFIVFGVVASGYLVVLAAGAPAAVRIVGGIVAAAAAVGVIGARSRAIRPRAISLNASTLRVGIRRITASSVTRATTQGDGDVSILVLGRGGLSAWPIVLHDREGALDERQRAVLTAFLARTAIERPTPRPDPYDPGGRFAGVGSGALGREQAIALAQTDGAAS